SARKSSGSRSPRSQSWAAAGLRQIPCNRLALTAVEGGGIIFGALRSPNQIQPERRDPPCRKVRQKAGAKRSANRGALEGRRVLAPAEILRRPGKPFG